MDGRARAASTRRTVRGLGTRGFTLLEVVVAVALAACAVAGAAALRPGAAFQAADAVRAFLLWGHLEAMWRGEPVAITPLVAGGIVARAGRAGDPVAACQAPVLRALRMRRFGRVTIESRLRDGMVWLPSGGARSCDGGGVISGRVVLRDGRRSVDVIVSSLGRMRVEAER